MFRGRYKAILVDADSYLLAVSRYIHRNPLEAGIIRKLDSYVSSSYPAYVGRTDAPGWLKTDFVLGVLGSRKSQYRSFVEQPGPDEVSAFFSQGNQGPFSDPQSSSSVHSVDTGPTTSSRAGGAWKADLE